MNYAPDLTVAALKMVLSLGLVLGVLWLAYRWARRSLPAGVTGARRRLIRVLGSQYLGVKKSIAVVQVPGTILVLGIGSEQINLLTQIDDPELLTSLSSASEREGKGAVSFKEQLQRMLRRMQSNHDPVVVNDDHGKV